MSTSDKPTPPEIWDCCGGGCSPCVWDTYYAALEEWQQAQGEPADTEKNTRSTSTVDTSDDHLFR